MAYDRFESRRGWREPRSRTGRDYGETRGFDRDDDDRGDRGFFERAGDEVASWFGDEEAERRRREDDRMRGEEDSWRRPGSFTSEDESGRYDRQARFRDEGYRRPYTGRFTGRRSPGSDDDRFDRGPGSQRSWSERWERTPPREFTGMTATTGSLHDPHYSEWRRRQIDALDRDYDEYRKENQSRFENEFSNWRTTRQGKRKLLDQVREHMEVVGSDDEQVGTVDCVRGDHIVLTKGDSPDDRHHMLSCAQVDRVEGDKVILDQPAAEAKRQFLGESREGGFFRDERDDERGPHMLNRSFSGTYER
ncbi:MAG: DUF2171 domain-containing protein [Sphingomicrobium sp.]